MSALNNVLSRLDKVQRIGDGRYKKTFARQPVDFTVKILYNSFIINNLQVNP